MQDNKNNKKYIGQFRDSKSERCFTFFIPSYQRGYRWTPTEVKALCNDLWSAIKGNQKNYCLQPLVVREKGEYEYEVVDGQQRLITLFLILKHIQERDSDIPFSIIFERNGKKDWWANLTIDNCKEHIETYHLYYAQKTIQEEILRWEKETNNRRTTHNRLYELITDATDGTFFIWHELPQEQKYAEDIFNRINAGKIQLTNAELIKGLLFNPQKENNETGYFAELASKWNEIERVLEDDSFWYFLVPRSRSKKYPTRIDFIWEYLYLSKQDSVNINDKYKIYHYFKTKYEENQQKFSEETFENLKNIFEQLLEWFKDPSKYHAIGFLLETGYSLKSIFELKKDCKNKDQIDKKLIYAIKQRIKKLVDFDSKKEDLEDKFYDIDYQQVKNKTDLRNLLLLCNIAALIIVKNTYYRFPFDIYKKEDWNVEHIHAINDATEEEDNSIGNLALLNADINKAYKDASFEDKRKKILEYEKEGKFIPLCTKNVFLKQYTESAEQSIDWNKEKDRKPYQEEMFNILKDFFSLEKFPQKEDNKKEDNI